jgi:hypothetical protein
VKRSGPLYQLYYLAVAGAAAGFVLLEPLFVLLEPLLELLFVLLEPLLELLLLFDLVAGAGAAVLVSAATGVEDFGASAAIDAAAKPTVNNAVMIRVPDLVIKSPNGWYGFVAKNTPDPRLYTEMKIISQTRCRGRAARRS